MRVTRVRTRPLRGTCRVPGDKSISHRAAMLAAIALGSSEITGFSPAGDCDATLSVLRALGVAIEWEGERLRIDGRGPAGLRDPAGELDCRRSGTTMRLMAGILAGRPFASTLTGDTQLLGRPMERVAGPLRLMGADVQTAEGGRPPIVMRGGQLRGVEHRMTVASAQVKSAVLLAGLQAEGPTRVLEPVATRDHTERLMEAMGGPARIRRTGLAGGRDAASIEVHPGDLAPVTIHIPGDFSSAAPLIAAAALVPGSDIAIEGVGLNPTRTGMLEILRRMGGDVRTEVRPELPEPTGNVRVRHASLRGTTVVAREIPALIDELPLVGLVATQAEGITEVRGAGELRVKESDRIAGLVAGLRALGGDADELEDGFVVRGPVRLGGGACDSRGDHRLAMTFTVASLVSPDGVRVSGGEFVADSFPGFFDALGSMR